MLYIYIILIILPLLSPYLDKIHGHKPHEVSVLGELLQILANSDRFLYLSKTDTQPRSRHMNTYYCKRQNKNIVQNLRHFKCRTPSVLTPHLALSGFPC